MHFGSVAKPKLKLKLLSKSRFNGKYVFNFRLLISCTRFIGWVEVVRSRGSELLRSLEIVTEQTLVNQSRKITQSKNEGVCHR